MKKVLLGTAGAFALAAVTFATGAKAQCLWTGDDWSCSTAPPVYYPQPYAVSPYPAWNSWDFQDYRLRPGWLGSYPGPKVSGGYGGNF